MAAATSTYIEFDVTAAALISELRTKINADPNWAVSSFDTAIAATSASSAVNGTTLTFGAGVIAAAGIQVGNVIRIGENGAGDVEWRAVTAIAATTVTVAAMSYAHASGTNIYWGDVVATCTTPRGADMKVNLADGALSTFSLSLAAYNNYTLGTTTAPPSYTNKTTRFIYWRPSAGAASHILHVTLSLSQDHMFISIEGPRAGETGAVSASVGSLRNYFFIGDMVPYHVEDPTPIVVVGGSGNIASAAASAANRNWEVHCSWNWDGTLEWMPAKLLTLDFPSAQGSEAIGSQRITKPDYDFYLFPYVVVDDDAGVRGRLGNFFYAGLNSTDNLDAVTAQVGAVITYDSVDYQLQVASKSEGATMTWGSFGGASNNAAGTYWKSPLVAVPVI